MRISTLLLFLFLSALLMVGVAPARGQATVDSLNFDLAKVDDLAIDQYRLPKHWEQRLGRLAMGDVKPAQDEVCYTMRSYKVERTERMDESTKPMKYSVCLPSSGFDVKNADESVVEAEEPQP
jgi:hypothetical protein